jgi:hypothetical protein
VAQSGSRFLRYVPRQQIWNRAELGSRSPSFVTACHLVGICSIGIMVLLDRV